MVDIAVLFHKNRPIPRSYKFRASRSEVALKNPRPHVRTVTESSDESRITRNGALWFRAVGRVHSHPSSLLFMGGFRTGRTGHTDADGHFVVLVVVALLWDAHRRPALVLLIGIAAPLSHCFAGRAATRMWRFARYNAKLWLLSVLTIFHWGLTFTKSLWIPFIMPLPW